MAQVCHGSRAQGQSSSIFYDGGQSPWGLGSHTSHQETEPEAWSRSKGTMWVIVRSMESGAWQPGFKSQLTHRPASDPGQVTIHISYNPASPLLDIIQGKYKIS